MNAEISESLIHSVTPGDCQDMYYPGKSNTELQCFPSTVENRFYVGLNATNFGSSSTVLFNPDSGVSDVVLNIQLPVAAGGVTYANWALARGWGYAAVRSLGFRVGSSSLFTISGDQMLTDTLDECEDQSKKDAVLALGGSECLTPADFTSQSKLSAYVYIKLPWNSISSLQKTLPLPSDLLTQPISLTIELAPYTSVFVPLAGASPAVLPLVGGYSYAACNFRQTHLADTGNLLARRVDMNSNAISYPLRGFMQSAFKTQIVSDGAAASNISLSGFRQGSVKDITLWAVNVADIAAGQPFKYVPLLDVQVAVNGLVYYQSKAESSQMWGICDRKTPTNVSTTSLTDAGGGVATATPYPSAWTVIPFAQTVQPLAGENEVALGLSIQNSIVNLQITFPAAGTYLLTASYKYISSLLFTRGNCDYIF